MVVSGDYPAQWSGSIPRQQALSAPLFSPPQKLHDPLVVPLVFFASVNTTSLFLATLLLLPKQHLCCCIHAVAKSQPSAVLQSNDISISIITSLFLYHLPPLFTRQRICSPSFPKPSLISIILLGRHPHSLTAHQHGHTGNAKGRCKC